MSRTFQDTLAKDAAACISKNKFGCEVVYKRGTLESETITGLPAEMQQEVANEDGFGTGVFVQAWAFAPADLELAGETIIPRAGDILEQTLNGVDLAFEAMPPAPNRLVYEWDNEYRDLILVWFKQVKR